MFRRRPGKSDSKDASAYSRRAAAADSVWVAQDRLRSESGPALERARIASGGPSSAAPTRSARTWSGRCRIGPRRWVPPARALSVAAAVLLAVGAGVAGLVWAAPDGPHEAPPTAVADHPAAAGRGRDRAPGGRRSPPCTAPPRTSRRPRRKLPPRSTRPRRSSNRRPRARPARRPRPRAPPPRPPSSAEPAAKAAAVDGPPAGPAAIAVARDFAGAFVLYETGTSDDSVRKKFGATATPALAKALLRRPPRLPANVKVPKAKVVNVVPAPSNGRVYPVSVSLLRVGLTSELRLEMEQLKGGGWRVTNVLG